MVKLAARLKIGLGLVILGWAGLLSGCGASSEAAPLPPPPQQACVIIEQRGPEGSPLLLSADYDSSPSYCQRVVEDYKVAMRWYQDQLKSNSYPPTMINDMQNYYTGELLQDARNSLFYNQQAGRVAVGRWNAATDQVSGPFWDREGLHPSLNVKVSDYKLLTFPTGQPQKETATPLLDGEGWLVRLVYDEQAGHWKLNQALSLFLPNSK